MDLGLIAHGPEIDRAPIVRDYLRLRNALVTGDRVVLEAVYIVPGSLGRADFEGLQIASRKGADGRTLVYMDVPAAVAESDDPLPSLVDLARSAIDHVRQELNARPGRSIDLDSCLSALDMAAASLGLSSPSNHDAPQRGAVQSGDKEVDEHDQDAAAVVLLVVRSGVDLSTAFEVETVLSERLVSSGVGYVDGNQVGSGEFEIFAYGPSADALQSTIEDVVRSKWQRRDALLRLTTADGEELTFGL